MTDTDQLQKIIGFYRQINKLKQVVRRGWELRDVPNPESVADHSFGVALLTLIFASRLGLDVEKALMIALLHEVGETVVGDITPFDGISRTEKARREEEAARQILSDVDESGALLDLWLDYHHRASAESRLVKELDGVEMVLQADLYEQETGLNLEEFFTYLKDGVNTVDLKVIIDLVEKERATRAT